MAHLININSFIAPQPILKPIQHKSITFSQQMGTNLCFSDLTRITPPFPAGDTEYYAHTPTRQIFSYNTTEQWTKERISPQNMPAWFGGQSGLLYSFGPSYSSGPLYSFGPVYSNTEYAPIAMSHKYAGKGTI
jgi:hypothetical protein